MTSVEHVWQQLKEKAADYRGRGIAPTQAQAEALVSHLVQSERIAPAPDRKVIEFYARELIALSKEPCGEAKPV